MDTVIEKIQELEEVSTFSKHEQLVNGIINAIDQKILVKGSMLPSVNQMVKELGFARKTIVKAYTDLKERGIIESKNRLGYFISNESTDQTVKIALILYAFHHFQEQFYNSFRASLGENIHIDVFFHHNNMEVFETILSNIIAKYGMYVIAPIQNEHSQELLKSIPPHKLLIVDRYLDLGNEYSHITQEFERPMFETLLELKEVMLQYSNYILFFRHDADFAIGVLKAYQKFMKLIGLNGQIKEQYTMGSLEEGTLYITHSDSDLWALLKDCLEKKWTIGEEIGILSQNETTVKEIISGGISTISTDFRQMAREAAAFVKDRKPVKKVIPSILIKRASLK